MAVRETNQSAKNTLDVLELFLTHSGLSLSEISDLSGLQKTVVSRIVSTLVERGYLLQRGRRGDYYLGTIYLNYSGVVKKRVPLRVVGLPYFIGLARQVNETITVGYLSGMQVLDQVMTESFLNTSQGATTYSITEPESSGLPLYCTSLGKAILAKLPDEAFEDYLRATSLVAHTANTISDPEALRRAVARIRDEGVAFDEEEYALGLSGVAAGVKDGQGDVHGAVAVVSPSFHLTRARMEEIAPAVRSCAAALSQDSGLDAVGVGRGDAPGGRRRTR